MQLSWILVAAVWCVLGRAECASIEGAGNVHDAHLIGGSPVDAKLSRPQMGVLLVKEGQKYTRSCEATFIRTRSNLNYYLTAAECFDRGANVQYSVRIYQNSGKTEDVPLNTDIRIYPKYDKVTKAHNLAVFRTTNRLPATSATLEINSVEIVPDNASVEVFSWKNVTRDHHLSDVFELHSLKSRTIPSIWCKLWYPFSPLKEYQLCVSGWFVKGLTKDQIGTPLIQRDPNVNTKFWLLGIATIVRSWAPYVSFPAEFMNIALYKTWIESIAI